MPDGFCHHRNDPHPPRRGTATLDAASLFVVALLRAWVSAQRAPDPALPDWRELCRLAGTPGDAGDGFGLMMGVIARAMRRPLDIRCCACPVLGAEEETMLRLVAAAQGGDLLGATLDLADWIAPEALPQALPGLRRFAAGMAAAALTLPPPPEVLRRAAPRAEAQAFSMFQ